MIPRRIREAEGSRLTVGDLLRVGSLGLRTRRLRAALSAVGISVGVAAIVGALGISQSSKSGLLNELGQFGNLLTAQPSGTASQPSGLAAQPSGTASQPSGTAAQPGTAELPATAEGMVSRIGPVTDVTGIASLPGIYVYRNPFIPAAQPSGTAAQPSGLAAQPSGLAAQPSGIALTAADATLPATLGASLAHGTFLNAATTRYPAVVLGADAASLLGIGNLASPTQVWIGGHWFAVIGILNPVELVTQVNAMAFIGFPIAQRYFGFDGHPTELYLRSVPSQVSAVYDLLPATVNPAHPSAVLPGEPAQILQAEMLARRAYSGLFLALGAVALLVGGIGIGIVMVISVLERRREIGLRRALGATRRHVAGQFLVEAVLLSVLGALAGTIAGVVATAGYALTRHWSVLIPSAALYGGIGAALAIGAIAGLYPAMRAARLSPTEALRTA